MAEGEMAMANPPYLAANEQTAAASDFDMDRMRSIQASNEPFEGSLLKGDITSARAPNRPAAEVPEEQQQSIETSLSAQRQQLDQIRKAEAKLVGEGVGSAEGGGKLFGGVVGFVVQKIPGVGMLMNRFKKSTDLGSKIKILEKMKRRLMLAKTTAAIVDAFRRWLEAFTATSETIIIPIFLIFGLIPWVVFSVIFELGPTTKMINQATKRINQTLVTLKKLYQQEQQRKTALADLKGMEIRVARNQVETTA